VDHTRPARTGTERTWLADVVVVGARCAGAATAMLLADAGHDVLVVDRASFPSDTVSTHVIARTGMVQLKRWGLLDALHDSGAPRLTTVELDTGGDVIVRTIKDRHGVDHLLAPRRIVLRPPPGRRTPGGGPDRDGGERRPRAAGRRRTGRGAPSP